MIIQLHITDQEIKDFFESFNYKCKEIELERIVKRTHGPADFIPYQALHVFVDGILIQAEALMNEYARMVILHPGCSPEFSIKKAAKSLSNLKNFTHDTKANAIN